MFQGKMVLGRMIGYGIVGEGCKGLHSPSPTPLLIFDCRPPPWYTDLFLSPLPLPLKSKHLLANITSALQASLREASPKSAREL